jgi:hypothetical protein
MSFCSWSGSYQVARVCGRPSQGRWAIDLMGFLLLLQLILGDADARAPAASPGELLRPEVLSPGAVGRQRGPRHNGRAGDRPDTVWACPGRGRP